MGRGDLNHFLAQRAVADLQSGFAFQERVHLAGMRASDIDDDRCRDMFAVLSENTGDTVVLYRNLDNPGLEAELRPKPGCRILQVAGGDLRIVT